MKKIVLLSDTHHTLDERFFPHFKECDEIWHAGDIGKLEITDKLKTFAPVRAVYGNIDGQEIRKEFRKTTYFRCEQVKVMMTHIGGYPGRYEKGIKEEDINWTRIQPEEFWKREDCQHILQNSTSEEFCNGVIRPAFGADGVIGAAAARGSERPGAGCPRGAEP